MALIQKFGRGIVLITAASLSAFACSSADPSGGGQPIPPAPTGLVPIVEAVRITDKDVTPVSGDMSSAAQQYVRTFDAELGLSDLDDFEIRTISQGRDNRRHVRLKQLHEGLRVWGSDVVVHADGERFLGLNGTLAKNLGPLDATPAVTADEALADRQVDLRRQGQDRRPRPAGLLARVDRADRVPG